MAQRGEGIDGGVQRPSLRLPKSLLPGVGHAGLMGFLEAPGSLMSRRGIPQCVPTGATSVNPSS